MSHSLGLERISLTAYIMSSGLQIECKLDEFAVFNPPLGQSCATWANDFVNAFGGYLDNPDDTQACRYCQYKAKPYLFDLASRN
jgi:hypothetical protein